MIILILGIIRGQLFDTHEKTPILWQSMPPNPIYWRPHGRSKMSSEGNSEMEIGRRFRADSWAVELGWDCPVRAHRGKERPAVSFVAKKITVFIQSSHRCPGSILFPAGGSTWIRTCVKGTLRFNGHLLEVVLWCPCAPW